MESACVLRTFVHCSEQIHLFAFYWRGARRQAAKRNQWVSRLLLKCDGKRAETRFCLSAKRTSPFKSAGAFVQSTTGSRGVRISGSNGSNAEYTMFQRWCEGYWLPTPFGNFPFISPPVRHRVPSRFNWTLTLCVIWSFQKHPQWLNLWVYS